MTMQMLVILMLGEASISAGAPDGGWWAERKEQESQ